MKKILITLFALTALVQIAAPLYNVFRWNNVLENGRQFKFRTAPVDPADPFRGRYVQLRFDAENVQLPEPLKGGSLYRVPLYALIDEDKDGFAYVKNLVKEEPATDSYVKVSGCYPVWRDGKSSETDYHVSFPFDRYYMNERKAPDAENAYRSMNRNGADAVKNSYATVRVKGKIAILDELYLDGVPVKDYLKKK